MEEKRFCICKNVHFYKKTHYVCIVRVCLWWVCVCNSMMGPDVPLTSTISLVAECKRSGGNYHLAWVILQSHFWKATYTFTVAICWCVQLSSCVVHSHDHHPVKCWLHGVVSCVCHLRALSEDRPFRYLVVIYY